MLSSKTDFFKQQILTYMGNKRKLIENIDNIISLIEQDFGEKIDSIGEGFSGSGIVSRLLKTKCNFLYVNDIAGYSYTLNSCYLTSFDTLSDNEIKNIKKHITICNEFLKGYNFATFEPLTCDSFISKYWAAKNDQDIKPNERVYFTKNNADRIDRARTYIEKFVEEKYRNYLLAPLLVESSIHNNTNGQFSAFFKDKNTDVSALRKSIFLCYRKLVG